MSEVRKKRDFHWSKTSLFPGCVDPDKKKPAVSPFTVLTYIRYHNQSSQSPCLNVCVEEVACPHQAR